MESTRRDQATGVGLATRCERQCRVAALLSLAVLGAGCDRESSEAVRSEEVAVAALSPSTAPRRSGFVAFHAPAGDRPAARFTTVDGRPGAVLPNGRFVTPAGVEVSADAPKPFGLALSPDGKTAATINSGSSHFSVTLVANLGAARPSSSAAAPSARRVDLDASFMGLVFSPDGARFYASGGENGNVWVGDTASGKIIGSVNLNGAAHLLSAPLSPSMGPSTRFKGAFPGNMELTRDGRFLYVVDQGSFSVHAVDTARIATGVDAAGNILEPNNLAAVVSRTQVGRYPFGIGLSPDERTLYVTNVGVFQYHHLGPATPSGDKNQDYPLCIPGVGYPDEVETDRTLAHQEDRCQHHQRAARHAQRSGGNQVRLHPRGRQRHHPAPRQPQRARVLFGIRPGPGEPRGAANARGAADRDAPSGRWTTASKPTRAATPTPWSRGAGLSTFRTATTTRSPSSTGATTGWSTRSLCRSFQGPTAA